MTVSVRMRENTDQKNSKFGQFCAKLVLRYYSKNRENQCSETYCAKLKCRQINCTKVSFESPTTHFKTKTRAIYAINDDVSKIM